MNELRIFTNEQFGKIRTLIIDNKPWFVGKDIAKVLGYSDTFGALKKHVDNEDKQNCQNSSFESNRGLIIINESGLYSLILSSKLPVAKKFKRWVTNEVLLSIREHGAYINQDAYSQMSIFDDYDYLNNQMEVNTKEVHTVNDNTSSLKIAYDSTILFNSLIDENGMDKGLKLIIAKKIFDKVGINIPLELETKLKKSKRKRNSEYIIEKSPYKDIVDEMIRNKETYEEITHFLKSEGVSISKSSVGRYAKQLLQADNKQLFFITSPKGGNENE